MAHLVTWATVPALLLLPALALGQQAGVFIDGASNVRDAPGSAGRVLFQPADGAGFSVLSNRGKWLQIRLDDGRTGWTHQQNIRLLPGRPAAEPGAPGADALALQGAALMRAGHRLQAWADLNGDGQPEHIRLVVRQYDPQTTETTLGLAVRDGASGALLWEDRELATPFVIADYGVEDLNLIGDLAGDGSVQMVSARAQSDVSPTEFRLLGWRGGAFRPLPAGFLVGSPAPEGFRWTSRAPAFDEPLSWVLAFEELLTPGEVRAMVIRRDGEFIHLRPAVLRASPGGYTLVRWLPEVS